MVYRGDSDQADCGITATPNPAIFETLTDRPLVSETFNKEHSQRIHGAGIFTYIDP